MAPLIRRREKAAARCSSSRLRHADHPLLVLQRGRACTALPRRRDTLAGLIQGSDGNFYGTLGRRRESPRRRHSVQAHAFGHADHTLLVLQRVRFWHRQLPRRRRSLRRRDPRQRRQLLRHHFGAARTESTAGCSSSRPPARLTTLYSFCSQGAHAHAPTGRAYDGLIQGSDGNFYGTTSVGRREWLRRGVRSRPVTCRPLTGNGRHL